MPPWVHSPVVRVLVELTHSGALLLSSALVFGFVAPRLRRMSSKWQRIGSGVFFGSLAALGMAFPVNIIPGVIIDGRVVVVGIAGLFGGFVSASVAVVPPVILRVILGGAGLIPGIGALLTGAMLGAWYRRRSGLAPHEITARYTSSFGFANAVQAVLWTFLLPSDLDVRATSLLVIPVLVLYPVGTVLLGKLIQGQAQHLEAEIDLVRSKERAEAALETESRFLDMAAHELRTPVTVLSLWIQMVQKRVEQGQPFDADFLPRIRTQIDAIAMLVGDILEASRLRRGVPPLNRQRVDLGTLVSSRVDDFRSLHPERKFEVTVPDAPVELQVDRVRIGQALSNLLEYAVKYSSDGTVIEVHVTREPDAVRVSVVDEGPGLPDEAEVFEPFHRRGLGNADGGGLGLGLSISKKVVELHGGRIAASNTRSGCRFFFDLPHEMAADA